MIGTSRLMLAGTAYAVVMVMSNVGAYAEISPMSRERLPEAERLGRDAARNNGPVIYMDMCRTEAPQALHMFEVTITTPFTAIAYVVFDSVKERKPLDLAQWPIETPGNQSVIVAVDPAGLGRGMPASVAKVVLRRGAQIIEPTHSDTHQVQFPSGEENQREYRGGTFYFSLEPFASEKGDLEIVVFPEHDELGAEAVVTLSKGHLSRMR